MTGQRKPCGRSRLRRLTAAFLAGRRSAPIRVRPPLDARRGLRGPKSAPVEGKHELFAFLTTDANANVAPNPSEGHAGHHDDVDGSRHLADSRDGRSLVLQKALPGDAPAEHDKGRENRWSDTSNRIRSPCKGIRKSPHANLDIRQDKLCRERFHSLVVMLFLQKSNCNVVSRGGVAS